MNPDPLVSVCVITYNQAPYIRECLDSILAQKTDFFYEVCLGEDGSNDGTRELCRDYAERHRDRIRLSLRDRTDPRRQAYRAAFMLNFIETVKACRGKYIAFCEGDDCWLSEDKLQRQADFLDRHKQCAMVAMGFVTGETAPVLNAGISGFGRRVRKYSLEDILCGNFMATASVMVRRDHVEFPEWVETLVMGDWMLWVICARKGWVAWLPEKMTFYRQHNGGVWSTMPRSAKWRYTASFLVLLKERLNEVSRQTFDRARKRRLYSRMIQLAQDGHLRKARQLFKKTGWAVWTSKEGLRNKIRGVLWVFFLPAMQAQYKLRNKQLKVDPHQVN